MHKDTKSSKLAKTSQAIKTKKVVSSELSFPSEAILQQAVAGLLTRMPDITGVQILQGAQELGKDLIFYIRGGFDEPVLCACVVKNIRITGDAGRSIGARTVLNQAEQAFDSVHTDAFAKEIRVERVYMVTPYSLPPATIASIKGRLQERSGQVVFIGGPTLFDLFKKYWPDYFADEAEIIEQHLKRTKERYEVDSPLPGLASLYSLGDFSTYPKKIYVSQTFSRDIYIYDLGTVLTQSLPTEEQLRKGLTNNELEIITVKFKNLKDAVSFLKEWSFCTDANKRKLHSSLDHFLAELKAAWRSGPIKDPNSPPRDAVGLPEPSYLINKLRDLVEREKLALAGIEAALEKVQQILYSKQFNGIQALSDPLFLYACKVDDCAHAAPVGTFTIKGKKTINFPKDILDKWSNSLLIVGAPGYGKTSFCRWNALQDAENFSVDKLNVLPVYVPLHRFSTTPVHSFDETFLETLGKSALLYQDNNRRDTRIRLYLDGLDEITSTTRRRELVDLSRSGIEGNPKYQIVLTSRDYVYARWLDWLPRIAISGFGDSDIREFVGKWLGENTESSKRFHEQLDELPAIENLMRIPLLATLIVMVFRQTGKLPENKPRLYEIFIDLLSGGWDLAKGILKESKFAQRVKVMILSTLAARLHDYRRREFEDDYIKTAVRSTLSGQIFNKPVA